MVGVAADEAAACCVAAKARLASRAQVKTAAMRSGRVSIEWSCITVFLLR
jgi:hypothetical protein